MFIFYFPVAPCRTLLSSQVPHPLASRSGNLAADMEFVKNFTPPDFQAKILHSQFHLISTVLVRKNTKNE